MADDAPLMLTVSGMRGVVGRSITPGIVERYAASLGNWLQDARHGDGEKAAVHVVVGRDSRPSGEMYEAAAVAGLIAVGCRVTRLGIVSTPGVAVMAKHLKAHGGLVITASHNPIQWNGLKPLECLPATFEGETEHASARVSNFASAPPADRVQHIIDAFNRNQPRYAPVDQLLPARCDDSTAQVHTNAILDHIDPVAIRKRPFTVVLDSVHGAGGAEALALLDALKVNVIPYYVEPTGQFPHPPEPTQANLTGLCDAVKKHGADLGFAQDPDADRLAIVDETGRYIGEEYTLALCARQMLQEDGAVGGGVMGGVGGAVAANLSTSRMIDDVAKKKNARVIRTPVGEANVAAAMRAHDATIGGEGNGGIIFAPLSYVRDSLVGMAMILALLAEQKRPLSQVVADMPAYAMVKEKVDVPADAGDVLERVREAFSREKIDNQDGVRIDWPDRWVHVRASNTEPILRIIAEAATANEAKALVERVRKIVEA